MFVQLRNEDEVRSICEEASITLSEDEFQTVFGLACEADGEADRCCLDTFFRARHHVLRQLL